MSLANEDGFAPKFWMEKAESIKASGRWSAINKQVERLASDPNYRRLHFEGDHDWLFEVFASLCAQILEEYSHLKKTYDSKLGQATSEIAWRARNLLELFIWSAYCSNSTENARRFYEDAERDMQHLMESFIKWGAATGQDSNWLSDFSGVKESLREKMLQEGINNIDDKYTDVRDAAKAIGNYESFIMENRLLSKFTHPTALLILRPNDLEEKLRDSFFGEGCLLFCGAFEIIEIWLRDSKEKAA